MNVYLHMGAYYKYGLGEWLIEYEGVKKCYIDHYPEYKLDKSEEELAAGLAYIPMWQLVKIDALDDFDWEGVPALGKSMLCSVLPYESMAIHIGYRDTEFPVTSYEETKRKYHNFLRYWNWLLQDKKIGFVFFYETPHSLCTYSLYLVAKVLNIPMLIITPTGIRDQYVYGTSIETIGQDISDYYHKIKDEDAEGLVLTGKVGEYYSKSLSNNNQASQETEEKKRWADTVYKLLYSRYDSKTPAMKIFYLNMIVFLSAVLKHRSIDFYIKNKISKKDIRRYYQVKLYKKYDSISREKYDEFSIMPDYTQKYIYFPLQQSPELTTIPLAGVFSEQYNSIQLLARVAEPFGIKIYVKEYYIQPRREISFWEDLKKISNVEFIKTSVGSDVLIKHSMGVANQTGTIILESVFENKPAFVFGGGHYWKDMPGVFEVLDESQGKKVFQKVFESDYEISKEDLKRYFYAIQQNSIEFNVDVNYVIEPESVEYAITLRELKKLFSKKMKG